MMNSKVLCFNIWMLFATVSSVFCRYDVWNDVACDKEHFPANCDFDELAMVQVDDYDRCGPARLPLPIRNYYLGAADRRITYKRNKDSFDNIKILPKNLRDVTKASMETTILGHKLDFPIGLSPTAAHKLAHPDGELATLAGITNMRTIMIVSLDSNTLYEDLADFNRNATYQLWMQMYSHPNRTIVLDLVRKAEESGFTGIVLTCDKPINSPLTCNSRDYFINVTSPRSENVVEYGKEAFKDTYATFEDIAWLREHTSLPIIAKGILRGDDAVKAVESGATAILVSNHGGRKMDGVPATIEALPGVVKALKKSFPSVEVYMDGGIRSGTDAYKALARGAKMVFVGRPVLWGLAINGGEGVRNVMNILTEELRIAMSLAGTPTPQDITPDVLIPNLLK